MSVVFKEKINRCYQCGKCSTGCPVADVMDMLPHQVVHLLGMEMLDRVWRLNTPWLCAGCHACAVRCPNDIDVTAVMGELRERAAAAGIPCPCPEVFSFHKNFLRDMSRRGRVHEMRMMGEYNARTGRPFRDAALASRMLMKGRLPFAPPKAVRGFARWVKKAIRP